MGQGHQNKPEVQMASKHVEITHLSTSQPCKDFLRGRLLNIAVGVALLHIAGG